MTSVKAKSAAPAHPKYIDMAREAIIELKDRKGSSRAAIAKVIAAKFNLDPEKIKVPLRNALKNGIVSGVLKRPAGTSNARGSGGRFRIGDVNTEVKPKPKTAAKKPATKPAKKPAAKTTAKSSSKKTAAKKKGAKSPTKAKTTKTSPKKKTTTKKATAGAGKKVTAGAGKKKTTKKPAAKKSATKKPAAKK